MMADMPTQAIEMQGVWSTQTLNQADKKKEDYLNQQPCLKSKFANTLDRINQQQSQNQSYSKESFLKKKTIISSAVVDKKLIKNFFGKTVTQNQGGISSYSSFRPHQDTEDFLVEKNCQQKCVGFLKKYVLIYPSSVFRLTWDTFTIICILYSCFENAYRISFDSSKREEMQWYEIIVECFFATDIMLNFIFAYYSIQDEKIITDFGVIAKTYVKKGYFFLDVVSTFPFQIFDQNIKVVKLLRMLRLPRFLKLVKEDRFINVVNAILNYTDTSDKVKTQFIFRYIYRNIQFILIGLILAFFVSCFWYYMLITINEPNLKGETFITAYGLDYFPDWSKTITNCYFVLTTFSTVGFGDVTPQTNTERIIVIVMMLCGVAFFSYIMNNFNDVLTNYSKKLGYVDRGVEVEEWILSLSNYTERTIDKKLVNQIQNHFEYFYRNSRLSIISQKDQYFELMPDDLKKELIKHLFQDIFYTKFRSLFLLNGKFECNDYGFYIDTAFQLIPMKYVAGDFICKQGEKLQEVYLVLDGEVEASFSLDGVKISRFFTQGFFFGAINILSNKLCNVDYKASKNVNLYTWNRDSFLDIVNRYQQMKEHIISASFQSYKTTKNSMIQAMISTYSQKKGIHLSLEAATRVFSNMVKYLHQQKSKSEFTSQLGNMQSTQAMIQNDVLQVEKRLNKILSGINQIDPSIEERRELQKQCEENQQQQLKTLIRNLDKQN